MSNFWLAAEKMLREMEADEEYDLFAIGYVIPQVALAEGSYDESSSPFEHVTAYIQESMVKDQVSDADQLLIKEVMDTIAKC